MDLAHWRALKDLADTGYGELPSDGEPRLVSQAPVTSLDREHAKLIASLGWIQIVDQDPAEAFQPVSAAIQSTAYTGLGALVAAGLLAFILAQALSAPLGRLTQVARRIAAGDLSQRVVIAQRDEIGVLADNFNTMAGSLEDRIGAEQQAQAEARRLQQIDAQGRELLERTVAEYLAFVQHVAQGDLTQRLPVSQNGALGQLGDGLNNMVVSLHTITSQVQHANANIAAAAAEILAATTQQAASAAEQSAALTQTTTTIEEVKAIAAQTAQQASQVAQESQAALQVARQGTAAVEETVSGMGQNPHPCREHRPDHPGAGRADPVDRCDYQHGQRAGRPEQPVSAQRGDRGRAGRRAGQELRGGGPARARAGRTLQGRNRAGARDPG